MRDATRRKIDELHGQIAQLIHEEIKYYDKKHPNEPDFMRCIAHTKIEIYEHSPAYRMASGAWAR